MEQQPVSTSEPAAKRWTTRELLAWTTNFLKEKTVESPRTLAEMLLSSVLGCERLRLYMEVDRIASPEELSALRALVVRAGRHEPIQFLLGQWSFHGREFDLKPNYSSTTHFDGRAKHLIAASSRARSDARMSALAQVALRSRTQLPCEGS